MPTPSRSAASSPLSSVPPSPSPSATSSRLSSPPSSPIMASFHYPTPPSSQNSEKGTSTPASIEDSALSSSDRDGPPPKKRRKTDDNANASRMPRQTKRLHFERMARDPTLESSIELDRLLKALRKKRKIVVIAGAGISVSAGIPDFRSSTGLFKSLKETHNLKGSGKQLFDAGVYRDAESTSTFHTMVREMSTMSADAQPTSFHHLVARLAHEGRLMRLYTQNVDGLENKLEPLRTEVPLSTKAPWPKTIQLHGGLEKMICSKCRTTSEFNAELFDQDLPPNCAECQALDHTRTEVAGKRSHGIGRLRPRMTLYNETGPDDDAIGACSSFDLKTRPDCILVVGTTLSVPGVRRIVREMCGIVRDRRDGLSVWVNLDPEPAGKDLENAWDLVVTGKADDLADKAALGRWDDPEVVEAVKEEDVKKDEIQIHVPTPRKPATFFDPVKDAELTNLAQAELQEQRNLLEPPTVLIDCEQQEIDVATAQIKQEVAVIMNTTNPASKGPKLQDVLGKDTKTVAGKNTRKPAAKSKKAAAKTAPKKSASAVKKSAPAKTNGSIKSSFNTTKKLPAAAMKDKIGSDIENVPTKGSQKTVPKKRGSKLNEVLPVDRRRNSSAKSPTKGAIFPNLKPTS